MGEPTTGSKSNIVLTSIFVGLCRMILFLIIKKITSSSGIKFPIDFRPLPGALLKPPVLLVAMTGITLDEY